MTLTVNILYTGSNGSARKFAQEMMSSGLADRVRAEAGNLRYEYYLPMDDAETVLLIDEWDSDEALDLHHKSPMMKEIAALREKYRLSMRVQKYRKMD